MRVIDGVQITDRTKIYQRPCIHCGAIVYTVLKDASVYCNELCLERAEHNSMMELKDKELERLKHIIVDKQIEIGLEKEAHYCSLYYASDCIPDYEEYMEWSRERVRDGWKKDE